MIQQGKLCVEKVKYPTAVDANIALFRLREKFGKELHEKRWYLCPECRSYHLTSRSIYQRPKLVNKDY